MNGWLSKGLYLGAWGAAGGAAGSLVTESFLVDSPVYSDTAIRIQTSAMWFGVIGSFISVALLVGTSAYLKKGINVGPALASGALFGLIAGALAGAIAEAIYSPGATEVLRIICWGIAGAGLGYSLGFGIPNLGQMRGLGGGLAGGLLGGCLFVVVAFQLLQSGATARVVGVAAIGFCIGLMITLVDTVFRQAWLEIRYGPKEARTVTLGDDTISIGSNQSACSVYVSTAPAIAMRYRFVKGQIFCEDLVAGQTIPVQPGDQRMVGNAVVTVCAAGTDSPAQDFETKY
jgi:hypothetical protein